MANATGRTGVHHCGEIAERNNWMFREQPINDIGIDAHMEQTDDTGKPKQLLALQIKTGQSWFKEKTDNYVLFRDINKRQYNYWTENSLPCIVVLYDPHDNTCVWQKLNRETIERTNITVLVGKNGGGKSSTLHALYGAPLGKTCSDFWFSTDVDPIIESDENDRNRYYYGYIGDSDRRIKEVRKARIRRSEDPDYWETTRPARTDGMLDSTRYEPVKKDVIYLDFRAEVSAFDKILHFSKEGLDERKDLLRSRSKYLNRLFENQPMRFPGTADTNVGTMVSLPSQMVEIISNILNKEYLEIKVAEHKLYKRTGTSVFIKTHNNRGYSEANAGSGEFAVVQLVRKIEDAQDYSLILLDEPEVSLHPAAQKKMKEYIVNATKTKKLQVVISSHSPSFIEGLPKEAIKLFKTDSNGKFYVEENVDYREAFYTIEDKVPDKKLILCEDFAAQEVICKTLVQMNRQQYFDVRYNHGGESTLVDHYFTSIATNPSIASQVYFIIDGDKDSEYIFEEEKLTKEQLGDISYLKDEIKKAFGMELTTHQDGGAGGERTDQIIEELLTFLRYYSTNVFFLPQKKIPEEILLSSEHATNTYEAILNSYPEINAGNAKEVIAKIAKEDYGDDANSGKTACRFQ